MIQLGSGYGFAAMEPTQCPIPTAGCSSLPRILCKGWSSLKGGMGGGMEGPALTSVHLAEQRFSCCAHGLALGVCAGRIRFSSSAWRLLEGFERRGRCCCPLHCPASWVSCLVVETAQGQPRGLPAEGGRAQHEPPIIQVGMEKVISATRQGNPHSEIVSGQLPAPSKSRPCRGGISLLWPGSSDPCARKSNLLGAA